MPRKKKIEPEVTETVEVQVPVDIAPKVKQLPVYGHVQVIEILEDRGAFIRCKMSNETVMDVPAHLF